MRLGGKAEWPEAEQASRESGGPMSRRHRAVWVVAVCGLSALGFNGTGRFAEATDALKVGYVDVSRVFDQYERTKRSESTLEQKGKQKENEMEQRLGELKKLREGLDLLSDKAREARAREIDQKADEIRRFGTYTKQDLVEERNRVAGDILKEIQQAVQAYAKANGFSIVLDERLLLYGQDALDVTNEVLKQLNAGFTTKGGQAHAP